ncbi:HAD-IC family P-type ATPase [Cupriavidus respiraculi]|uniref:Cation-transporting ATPase F n=1 Tax=Cupriavidus respiraculi TaxID=195930 RepID=A0ABM8WHK7_9BURK|nr:HAD-IC family P-type ATPase [Cupriavidus respiraculi]CAG9166560.1 putative cation-transporting ATPase F [Cupriavidus respiraculi]
MTAGVDDADDMHRPRPKTGATERGLTAAQAAALLARIGPNALPQVPPPSLAAVFLRQFRSPLIYILLVAALVSLALSDAKDAIFIGAVLLLNGIVGTAQEYSAGKAAAALRRLEQPDALVIRDDRQRLIAARDLVPGDLVLIEAGGRVPADIRLVEAGDLQCDESLLTGASLPVNKFATDAEDRCAEAHGCLAYAGTVVTRGRGQGVVVATGAATEIGRIAKDIGKGSISQPPLMIRLARFSRAIALSVGVALVLLVAVGLWRGMDLRDLFMMSVGLAVSAIPEGLPVAISVALAIGMRRMSRANVIVRKMSAVESLGSCTMIATDKTGTLTMNALMVTDICLPDGTALRCQVGHDPEDATVLGDGVDVDEARQRMASLVLAATLPNEAELVKDGAVWKGIGDTVDVALLTMAINSGALPEDLRERHPLAARIPYEPDLRYAASFHESGQVSPEGAIRIFVKGAPETLIAMSDRMEMGGGAVPIRHGELLAQKDRLAAQGLRVLAFAQGEMAPVSEAGYGHGHLINLTFLGLVGMKDPVRPEVPAAIRACHDAGIQVAMVTGDDPATASAIAAEAGLVFSSDQVVTGDAVARAEEKGDTALDRLTDRARIYARVNPSQKLAIVLSLARTGHFVAVTGDGVNDAPALKHAHVGVAMGRKGTEVAKESADIVITDENFASIVHGIREGRVAYANIRKVIFMLVSTGAAEVVLFLLAMPLGLPMPLLPVQLLWLNLVTNGIQDVALAAERGEGDELSLPPRKPAEPIFDRVMLRRILHSTMVMGVGGCAVFYWLLRHGYTEEAARNLLLLLFVLFENFQTFNSRSERHSIFRQGFLANPLLVLTVLGAQVLHIAALYIPGLSATLQLAPVSLAEWSVLLLLAATLFAVMELEKRWDGRMVPGRATARGGTAAG